MACNTSGTSHHQPILAANRWGALTPNVSPSLPSPLSDRPLGQVKKVWTCAKRTEVQPVDSTKRTAVRQTVLRLWNHIKGVCGNAEEDAASSGGRGRVGHRSGWRRPGGRVSKFLARPSCPAMGPRMANSSRSRASLCVRQSNLTGIVSEHMRDGKAESCSMVGFSCRAMRLAVLVRAVSAALSQDSVECRAAHAAPASTVSDWVAADHVHGRLMRLKGGAAWSESPAVSVCRSFSRSCAAAAAARSFQA